MDIIIVCHTEFGFVTHNKNLIYDKSAISGVRDGVLNLLALVEKYNAKVSFAVCPEVVPYFPKNISHEIGLHIHPGWKKRSLENFTWFSGDTYLREHCVQSKDSNFLEDFSYLEQLEMIQKGKEYLSFEFKKEPTFFVPGKSSFNNDTARALVDTGFNRVCSVFPGVVDNSATEHQRIRAPYCPDEKEYQKKGKMPILLIPVSQTIFGGSISPEGEVVYGLSWLKACFLEYFKQGVPLFHIYLHSSSMTDPYYISVMDKFLSFITKQKDIHFKFVSEINKYPEKRFSTNIVPYILGMNRQLGKKFFRKYL